MQQRTRRGLLGAVLVAGLVTVLAAGPARAQAEADREARIQLGPERYLRVFMWSQVWARYLQNNPGSVVRGEEHPQTFDIGLRRARIAFFGQVAPRIRMFLHAGINNQTSVAGGQGPSDPHRPQLYFHDAYGEFRVTGGEELYLGAGLHYWAGPTRQSSISTITQMGLDSPIFTWPALDRTDQIGRQLGAYAKGKLLERLDYRVGFNRPFITTGTPGENVADFNENANTYVLDGYAKWDFLEVESNVLPFFQGTYLGTKRVFNVGAGAYFSPHSMTFLQAGAPRPADTLLLAADAFLDVPLGPEGSALTAYLTAAHYDFGPNHVRVIGVMNPATGLAPGVTSFAGPGNGVPLIGTGWHFFGQAGYVLPQVIGPGKFQPIVSLWVLPLEGLGQPVVLPEVGLNWFVVGHHAKLTAVYRSRPVFQVATAGAKPTETERRSEVILQTQVYF